LAFNLPHQSEVLKKCGSLVSFPVWLPELSRYRCRPYLQPECFYRFASHHQSWKSISSPCARPMDTFGRLGYWGYGSAGYYWIPGAWVAPPQAGFLWTPGYWGFAGGLYSFNAGYWGPTVGFYGGVNYGFGYGGNGFDGGRWQGGHFAYNTAVSRVNTTVIHNTYSQNVNYGNNRTSFNGAGGIGARPSSEQTAMARQHNQPAAVPAARQRASAVGPAQARQATANQRQPAATQASAGNRNAETQNRMATRAAPSAARPEQEHQAAAPRAAPQQQTHAAGPQPVRQVASNRSEAPSRPAPQQQRPQATHAAAPEHAAARPEGKEERK
jgi:hypothetical protein